MSGEVGIVLLGTVLLRLLSLVLARGSSIDNVATEEREVCFSDGASEPFTGPRFRLLGVAPIALPESVAFLFMGGIFMERIFVLVVSKRISPQDSRTVPMVSRGVELSIFPERMSFQRL